jgi:GNAT superfamily N-acetyltransferase
MITVRSNQLQDVFIAGINANSDYPAYVSPMKADIERLLDPTKNPFCLNGHGRFEVFTAYRQDRPVGRIVASIHDASNKRHQTARAQFGFFDCVDDTSVADSLLQAAEDWCRERGCSEIVGNFNLTAMQMAGVVTSGFEDAPYTDMMWTAPHIARHLERFGYAATFPMTTFETDLLNVDVSVLDDPRHAEIANDPDFSFLPITRRTFKDRLADARLVLNSGFDKNPMFVPVTPEEYMFQAGDMMWVLDRRLSVVVHREGRPVGVVVCIPDLNAFLKDCGSRTSWMMPYYYLKYRLTRKRAVIIYYSVATEMQGRGINRMMLSKVITAARDAGYEKLGTTWIADVNQPSLKQMQILGAKPLHRLNLYAKQLGTAA